MKSAGYLLLLMLFVLVAVRFTRRPDDDKWEVLFNGKDLTGWDTYLGPDMDSTGKKINDTPIGLNNDPRRVFSIVSLDGGKGNPHFG